MLTPPIEYRHGKTRVPGRVVDRGRKDTVPAELSPGEAVLNVQAADKLGRRTIGALNREGLRERGDNPSPERDGDHFCSGLERAMYEHADREHPVRR